MESGTLRLKYTVTKTVEMEYGPDDIESFERECPNLTRNSTEWWAQFTKWLVVEDGYPWDSQDYNSLISTFKVN